MTTPVHASFNLLVYAILIEHDIIGVLKNKILKINNYERTT